MEAFASGVVVVGTNVGVLADIGNEAVTVNPGDSDGLARKIEALIHHPETICALQIKNREYAELFSSEWTFKEYTKLYNELIIQKYVDFSKRILRVLFKQSILLTFMVHFSPPKIISYESHRLFHQIESILLF